MTPIKLPPRCDRAAVLALLPEFVAAGATGRISVDASEVSQVGQAALQLLVSARQSPGGATILPSAALLDAAELACLGDALFDGEAQ